MQAWSQIFPGLFEPMSAMPAELQAHLRFPEDLFIAQNQSYRLYHLPATEDGATNFYNQEDRWAIPDDVRPGQRSADGAVLRDHAAARRGAGRVRPDPAARPGAAAEHDRLDAARMDPGVMASGSRSTSRTTPRPMDRPWSSRCINQDDAISAQFSLWSIGPARSVVRGNLLVLPLGETRAPLRGADLPAGSGAPFPEFMRVIMVGNGQARLRRERARRHRAGAGRRTAAAARRRGRSSCRGTWPAWWRRRSGSMTRRRPRWRPATWAPTRIGMNDWRR